MGADLENRESFERRNSFDGVPERDTSSAFMTTQDYHVKDAFLVFRALCKLSMKPIGPERLVTLAQQ